MNLSDKEEMRVRERMNKIVSKIDKELTERNHAASSELDHEMSDARFAGLNAEYNKLEKLLK